MPAILIIGYGSDLRGDDALGPMAACQLAGELADDQVRVLSCPSLTPELAAEMAMMDLVIFIDCSQDGPRGQVIQRPVAPRGAGASMVHFLDPPALLGWARELYGSEPRAILLTIAGESFDISQRLSPSVEAAMPRLLDRVRRIVDEARPTEGVARA